MNKRGLRRSHEVEFRCFC